MPKRNSMKAARKFNFYASKKATNASRRLKDRFTGSIKKGQSIEASLKPLVSFSKSLVRDNKRGSVKKGLVYNPFAKEVVRKNPGMMKSFFTLFKDKTATEIKDLNGNYIIRRTYKRKPKMSNIEKGEHGFNISEGFVMDVKVDGKTRRLFIKAEENSENLNHNTYSQYFGTQIQKIFGLSTIDAHLAYTEIGKKSTTGFFVSDFTDLIEFRKAKKQGLISKQEYKDFLKKVKEIDRNINRELPNLRLELTKDKVVIKDFLPKNVFIDLKTRQLYFFDPWLAKDSLYTKVFFFLQRTTNINI